MYTIYKGKLPNGEWKVGCDCKYPNRPLEQNLTDYFILEEHEDIMIASNREKELQLEHNVEVDNVMYHISCQNSGFRKMQRAKSHQQKAFQTMLSKNPDHQSKAGKLGGITNRILTMDDARKIRSLFCKGDTYTELAKQYNVSYTTIYRIIKNDRYKEK